MTSGVAGVAPKRAPPGRWRILAPGLALWAYSAGAVVNPGIAVAGVIAGALLGLVCLVRAMRMSARQRWSAQALLGAGLILSAVLVMLGARIMTLQHARADPVILEAASAGSPLQLEVELAGYPERVVSAPGEQFWVRANARLPRGKVPLLLWLSDAPSTDWAPGVGVVIRGIPTIGEAGGAAFSVRVDQSALASGHSTVARLGMIASGLRADLRTTAAAVPGAELVPGFAVGDTALVGQALDRAMIASSLSHLTAVSGANCALVTGVVIRLAALLGARRRLRLACAGVALAGFVIVVGPDASVERAAVMATVLLVSGFGGRRRIALPALGLAILVLLWRDPWQALQPGFALSVAATAGILMVATPLTNWMSRRLRLPRWLSLLIAVALAAQFACGPLLLLLQPGVPVVGVLANVVAAPAAPIGTGLGLIALILTPVGPLPALLAVWLAALPARWVVATAELAAGLPLARWDWSDGWLGAALLAACQAMLVVAWALRTGRLSLSGVARVVPRRPWERPSPAPLSIRVVASALAATALGIVASFTVIAPTGRYLATPKGWSVVACDVGQGDAILLRDPELPGHTVLVDTGNEPDRLRACLDRFGVSRISTLVLTHDDLDHVGALESIVGRVDAAVIAPTIRDENTAARPVVRQLSAADVPTSIGERGMARSAAGVRWSVLAPEPGKIPSDRNAASLVMRVWAGDVTLLLLADTGEDEQRALIATGQDLRATVLKVAHHGSADQDPRIAELVDADWGLISVGSENRYGHPTGTVLTQLVDAGTTALRTDLHGSIALTATADGDEIEAWVERGAR